MTDRNEEQAGTPAPRRHVVLLVMAMVFVLDVVMRPMMPTNETRYLGVACGKC